MSKKSTYYEIRKALSLKGTPYPVVIVDGKSKPKLEGEGWCYRNISGDLIHYPSAYSAKGWSSMVYHASTYQIKVGMEWVKKNTPEVIGRLVSKKMLV